MSGNGTCMNESEGMDRVFACSACGYCACTYDDSDCDPSEFAYCPMCGARVVSGRVDADGEPIEVGDTVWRGAEGPWTVVGFDAMTVICAMTDRGRTTARAYFAACDLTHYEDATSMGGAGGGSGPVPGDPGHEW